MKSSRKLLIFAILMAVLTLFSSCGNNFSKLSDTSTPDVFCRTFIDYVIADEKEKTFDLFKDIGTRDDLDVLWNNFRDSAEGSSSADIHMTNFWFFTQDSTDFFKGQYFVEFDNGSSLNLSLNFKDGETIYEVIYLDITEFYSNAKNTASILNTVLMILSIIPLGFSVWMIVDIFRRPIRKKVLWIILTVVGISFTFIFGEYGNHISTMIGLIIQTSGAYIDFGYLAVAVKINIPVGAIIYCCLRKRFTVVPQPSVPDDPEPFEGNDTEDPQMTDGNYTSAEEGSSDPE